VMAIEDDTAGRWGVQFHLESILTASGGAGYQVIANVIGLARSWSCEAVGAALGEHGHLPGGPALHVAALEPVQRVLGDLAPAVVDRERVATVLEVYEVRDRR
jgi:hypothetical protein